MDLINALILSIIEGITEFLPISSTGHLILASKVLGIPQTEFVKSFEIIIQSGAILSVIVLYGKSLLNNSETLKKTIIAFIPTGVIGLGLYKVIKDLFIGSSEITVAMLLLGGIAMIGIEIYFKNKSKNNRHPEFISGSNRSESAISSLLSVFRNMSFSYQLTGRLSTDKLNSDNGKPKTDNCRITELTYRKAFLIGVFQGISVIPGVSRSASTIFGGLFMGLDRKSAVEFSFFLAIPTMLMATGYDLLKSADTFSSSDFQTLTIGFVTSFIVALLAIKWLLRFIHTNTFIPFGIYRIILAILFFLIVK